MKITKGLCSKSTASKRRCVDSKKIIADRNRGGDGLDTVSQSHIASAINEIVPQNRDKASENPNPKNSQPTLSPEYADEAYEAAVRSGNTELITRMLKANAEETKPR